LAGYLAQTAVYAEHTAPIFFGAVMVAHLGGAVHGQLLRGRLHAQRAVAADPAVALALSRRALRQRAIHLARRDPALARHLRIGRPDLPRDFDDGGLVDINAVPEPVLAALPGLTAHHARQIVLAREQGGPFATVDELVGRGLLARPVVDGLRDTLIAPR
jgi:hypothetical protein